MKLISIFVALFWTSHALAVTPSMIVDGSVKFAIGSINGLVYFDAQKMQSDINSYNATVTSTPLTIVNYTPAQWEISLSTCLWISVDGKIEEKFKSYDEWLACQTRIGLKSKISRIRTLIDSMSDLPASESRDLRERAGWLKSYYLSLP